MKNLTKAWLAVMAECPYVAKERIAALGYTAAMEADLLRVVRPAMVKHGIALFIIAVEAVSRERFTNAKGTSMTSTAIKATARLVHADTGETMDIQAIGEGSDSSDKGYAKAHTIALKYLLRQSLLIETGDDPDKERPVMDAAPPPPPPPPAGNDATAELSPLPVHADNTLLAGAIRDYLAFSQPGKEASWPTMALAMARSKAPAVAVIEELTPQQRVEVAKMIHAAAVKKGAPADLLDRLAECMAQLDDLANGGGK